MKNTFFVLALMMLFISTSYSQSKTVNCDGSQPIKTANDNVKMAVYRAVGLVKGASAQRLSNDKKKQLENEYNELKNSINSMYLGIRNNTSIFSDPSMICQLFLSQLQDGSTKGYNYANKVDKLLKKPVHGSGGSKGIGEIVDFLINLASETRGAVFYSRVKWEDWKTIPPTTN